jgi:hypothetical protein
MMVVRRTGAKRGTSPTWYVSADLLEEQAAIRAGLLEERSPDARWRFVLAWGFPSRIEAVEALARLRPAVAAAIGAPGVHVGDDQELELSAARPCA